MRTTKRRRYTDQRGFTVRLTPRERRRGNHRVTISAERGGRSTTATLIARRL